jgi:O-methyltransferase
MATGAAEAYLDLLKRVLTRYGFDDAALVSVPAGRRGLRAVPRRLQHAPLDLDRRRKGGDLPAAAETMIGLERLDNLQQCIETVIRDGVPGDLIETGVWRGGACIFMRGVLRAHDVSDRVVWVADSFAGLPPPDAAHPADAGDDHWTRPELAVSRADVERNFERYGLLDEQVRFVEGWFSESLPAAPVERLAVARLDGDMYGSTMDALEALYDRVSPGGFVIIDDYGAVAGCRAATDDFRARRGISEPLQQIDWTGAYWRKSA